MESTGEPDRIQISSSTADVLKRNGKGHWLLPRQDLVEVKGKGTFQTYWLVNVSSSSTIKRSTASGYEGTDNWPEDTYIVQEQLEEQSDAKAIPRRRRSVGELYEL